MINPKFDLESNGISIESIKDEVNSLIEENNDGNHIDFPVVAFPKPVQDIIIATNESLGFPMDYIGCSLLFAASLAIGNTHKIRVKPDWEECSVLYLVLVGLPGANKSHPMSFALKPFQDLDNRLYSRYLSEKAAYDAFMSMSKQAKAEEEAIEKPSLMRYLIKDHTVEALIEKHDLNKRGIGVCPDELGSLINSFDRYRKGGDMELYLSNWNSKPITYDRKTSEPIHITNPFISIIGSIQSGILFRLAADARSHNGFIDRFLFSFPYRQDKPRWNEKTLDPSIRKSWSGIINQILSLELILDRYDNPNSTVIEFSSEAHLEFVEWYDQNVDLVNQSDESIRGVYAKGDMVIARLALILQLLLWSCGEEDKDFVGIRAFRGAVQLMDYFRYTARRVYSIIADPKEMLHERLKKFIDSLDNRFTTKEAISIGKTLNYSDRHIMRFLADKRFFKRIKKGEYELKV